MEIKIEPWLLEINVCAILGILILDMNNAEFVITLGKIVLINLNSSHKAGDYNSCNVEDTK